MFATLPRMIRVLEKASFQCTIQNNHEEKVGPARARSVVDRRNHVRRGRCAGEHFGVLLHSTRILRKRNAGLWSFRTKELPMSGIRRRKLLSTSRARVVDG